LGAAIRREHIADGLREPRDKRKNHADSRVADLIAVPQYADLLDNEEESEEDEAEHTSSCLVNSRNAWRKTYVSWVAAARLDATEDSDADIPEPPAPAARLSRFLPARLSKLFGGRIPQPPKRPPRRAFTREEMLMDLLAAEHSGEEPAMASLKGREMIMLAQTRCILSFTIARPKFKALNMPLI
jgi:hypothetical protein